PHDALPHRRHRNTPAHDRTVGNLDQTRSDGRIPRNLPLQLLHRTVAGLGQRPHPDHHLRQRRQYQLVGRNSRLQPPKQLPCPLFHVHTPYSLRSALVHQATAPKTGTPPDSVTSSPPPCHTAIRLDAHYTVTRRLTVHQFHNS